MSDIDYDHNLHTLVVTWVAAKDAEEAAVKRRRAAEDLLLPALGIDPNIPGTETEMVGQWKVSVTTRIDRKVDEDLVQEIAAEHGLSDLLPLVFRWKAEVNTSAWKTLSQEQKRILLQGITSKPGRPSFKITRTTGDNDG